MADLNEISAQEIGRRIRLARENAGIRQEEAAQAIGLSRPTLVSIEKGTRRVRIQELQSLAGRYGVSVNAILRREAVHTDLVPRFRKLRETEDVHTAEAVQLLNDLVKAEVELENVLGVVRERRYPPERGISSGNVVELAERHAQELRDELGLGSGPVTDIFTLIELDLGIRLYQRRLRSNSKVSGLFAFDPSVGACILLNANHPWERRVQSAAHELGHFTGTRQMPEVLELNEQFLSREERYAHAFARAFLTPRKALRRASNSSLRGPASSRGATSSCLPISTTFRERPASAGSKNWSWCAREPGTGLRGMAAFRTSRLRRPSEKARRESIQRKRRPTDRFPSAWHSWPMKPGNKS